MTKDRKKSIDLDYGVDSRYESSQEHVSEATALMEARLQRMRGVSNEEIIKAKLLQLKLRMEEYIKSPVYDNQDYFSDFLKFYIDSIYTKRSTFAEDIDVAPVTLSHVINKHREPQQEFIMKLMIHSEKVYKNICEFHKKIWYQVYYHEKICDTMSNQEQWRPEIEKLIKVSKAM